VRTLEERVIERTQDLSDARNELRELSARLLKTQDEERRRIARELHDGIGQLLAAMNMNLSVLLGDQANLSAAAAKSVQENINLVDQASQDIRTMSHLLHPPLLDEVGLGSALQWYVGGFAERSKIAVSIDLAPALEHLSRDLELSLFRIVQECLTNIHRHSGSSTAQVHLYRVPGEVRLEVRDEGRGIPPGVQLSISSGSSAGVGLRGIRERVRQFGGRIEIQSSGRGTTVLAVLPDESLQVSGHDSDVAEEQNQPPTVPASPSDAGEGVATILCIDDEDAGLLPRKLLLESAGHRVIEARSGAEGIRLFESEKVDAVVLDYWMSGMKGTAVAAELKRLDPSVPIIMLSGLPDFPGETMGIVDEWLLKGSSRAEHLLDKIRALLERRLA
jgi:CheY-like chemotaxis protein